MFSINIFFSNIYVNEHLSIYLLLECWIPAVIGQVTGLTQGCDREKHSACLWLVGVSQSSQRKATQTQGEHANPTQKDTRSRLFMSDAFSPGETVPLVLVRRGPWVECAGSKNMFVFTLLYSLIFFYNILYVVFSVLYLGPNFQCIRSAETGNMGKCSSASV